MKIGRFLQLITLVFALAVLSRAMADELPPGLTELIRDPEIPVIADATILRYTKEGFAEVRFNQVFRKPEGSDIPKQPVVVKGKDGKALGGIFIAMKHLAGKEKTRYLMFLEKDYQNLFGRANFVVFEIREAAGKPLEVDTLRGWQPLTDVVKAE